VTRPRVLRQLRLARLVGRVRARAPPRGPRPVRSGRVVPFDAIRVGRFGLVRARPRLAASRVGWFGLVRRVAVCWEPCRMVRSGQACRRLLRAVSTVRAVRACLVAFDAIRVDGRAGQGVCRRLRCDPTRTVRAPANDGSGARQRRLRCGPGPGGAGCSAFACRWRVMPRRARRRRPRRRVGWHGARRSRLARRVRRAHTRAIRRHVSRLPGRVPAPAGGSAHGALRSAPGMLGCVDARARPSRHATTALRRRPRGPETASRSGSPPASSRSALASHDHGGRTFATCSR
jgi:hypothetical protein